MADDPLSWLQSFYRSLCDGDWEHSFGCDIGNVDNPGWTLTFDLTDTDFQSHLLDRCKEERSEDDWLHYWKEDVKFEGRCGPENLSELLTRFRHFIDGVAAKKVTEFQNA
ncbi:immunity 53 family protein [Sphingomonas sp. LB3N6]|uniref:immunity 53 family protein n=1 Tax=Sphingomonas fucosidasi TaxID=3096164 RepID=UPI002FCB89C5